jgi:hypothetical protein
MSAATASMSLQSHLSASCSNGRPKIEVYGESLFIAVKAAQRVEGEVQCRRGPSLPSQKHVDMSRQLPRTKDPAEFQVKGVTKSTQ